MAEQEERLEKLMSRLGYGARKDVPYWIKEGWLTVDGRPALSASQKVLASQVQLEGEALDHPDGLTVVYHKPLGVVCSRKEVGRLIYDDLPARWLSRKPALSSVGRLDKDTSGLLIITDDGQLNHFLTSPKNHIAKTYAVSLAQPLQGHEVELFAAGTLMLENDDKPCLPAELEITGETTAKMVLHEGRYHQVRRMFAAVGNHVARLSRTHTGKLALADLGLTPGAYTTVAAAELMAWVEAGRVVDRQKEN